MSGLVFGFVVGGVALLGGLIWAVYDNLFVYKRKEIPTEIETPDGDQTNPEGDP
jgi:hypothetical protein